ncbi:hypothetical protein C0991_005556 [Blastosporella zonata]|nr:hypothetical protein C0991_005556 [Blastosporella zonata]
MSSKDRHYWAQLRLALTSGQWSSKYPAKAPDGTALPWSELLRKFNKHCRGFQDVAQVASYTQALALLLSANTTDEDEDDAPVDEAFEYPVELGSECVLPEERIEEARTCYDALASLQSSNFDSLNFALAYYAYALGNPTRCLSHLSGVPDLLSVTNHIPTVSDAATRGSTTTGHSHHMGLHVPSFSTSTTFSSAGGSFASLSDSTSPEIKDGRAWAMTETVRSMCLQGMSHEKLSPQDPKVALKAYSAALPLFEALGGIFADPTSSASTPSANTKIFLQQRELWRWVERLLWRAIVLSARVANPDSKSTATSHEDVWTWLRLYAGCSIYWPATFRTSHRSTISVLYFRATILRYHPLHAPSPSPQPTTSTTGGEKGWLHAARTVVNDYRAILGVCTTFPRAGERNVRVEDFVDLCVGVWEAGGASGDGAGWVIDILWWATRLTFNSHRILRHMTRVLHIAGDTTLARRTLLLYVQVVGKAYEASRANVSTPSSSKNSSRGDLSAGEDEDSDSDKVWVETLVYGSRMLCRWAAAQTGLEGLKEVKEAGECIEKARTRLHVDGPDGIRLATSVDLAEGVWNSIMTLKGKHGLQQDPHTRPGRLAAAHTLFLRACSPISASDDFTPDPAALYHLALSFAHPGPVHDLEQAILHAGRAVEADPQEIRYWHLLGLLLAAAEKWTEAQEILESGAAIGEDEDILAPTQDHPPLSKEDLFEYALQLRMTQGVLAEVIDGAEGAEEKWLEVFSWVAAQRTAPTIGMSTPRASVDGGRPMTEKAPSFVIASPTDETTLLYPTQTPSFTNLNEKRESLHPIPITVSLAAPESEDGDGKQHNHLRKRSSSIDRDTSKSKKVQQMLKHRVHQGRERVSTISRKIGNGVVRTGSLKRSNSTPADSWLMSAATFRRLGKSEQARGAIQEAEVKDEGNAGVWVQLGLYFIAHGQQEHAMDAYQKALFINPDDASASVHLARLFLSQHEAQAEASSTASSANVDLATGMLGHLTRGNGWNVPEAWYYLAKAYGLQGRKKRERECLDYALALSASRGIREVGAAVGWCI